MRTLAAVYEIDEAFRHTQLKPYHFAIQLLDEIQCCDLFTVQLSNSLIWWQEQLLYTEKWLEV